MTDYNREDLIEKAAATIAVAELVASRRTWCDLLEPQKDEYRRLATQVLTVFEQAHAPSSDEREALREVVARFAYRPVREAVDAILAAGFRRPEVPEPQAEPTDAQVGAAYRAHVEARMGRELHDAEFEATKSRVEVEWLHAALSAAFKAGGEGR